MSTERPLTLKPQPPEWPPSPIVLSVPLKTTDPTPLLDRSWLVMEKRELSAPPSAAAGAGVLMRRAASTASAAAIKAETPMPRRWRRQLGAGGVTSAENSSARTMAAVRTSAVHVSAGCSPATHAPHDSAGSPALVSDQA